MPKSLKLGLICVLLLSACGTSAAQVTVSGAPSTTSPPDSAAEQPTVAGDLSDDKDDVDTFRQLNQFVQAANDAFWTGVRVLDIPGITLLEADQPSVDPGTISLALLGDDDFAAAILSPSGTCMWYAFIGHEDRFGDGEPCTATAALAGSSAKLSADSPWHLVLDQSESGLQAKATQAALRNALVAAKTFYSDAGNFNGVSPEKLQAIEPSLTFIVADDPSTAADIVSVAVVGNQFGAAAMSANGTCYWIAENLGGSGVQYGQGTPCTGTAALATSGSAWN